MNKNDVSDATVFLLQKLFKKLAVVMFSLSFTMPVWNFLIGVTESYFSTYFMPLSV
jgi:hypothetical protein